MLNLCLLSEGRFVDGGFVGLWGLGLIKRRDEGGLWDIRRSRMMI